MITSLESFEEYPFILRNNEQLPKCEKCNEINTYCYCQTFDEFYCQNCFNKYHKSFQNLYFDLIDNKWKYVISQNKENKGIKNICLCDFEDEELFEILINRWKKKKTWNEQQNLLHFVCNNSDVPINRLLKLSLRHGMDPNLKNKFQDTPFMIYCNRDNPKYKIIKLFFEKGANPNKVDFEKNTPFHIICKKKKINNKIVKCFLNNGAETNKQNIQSKTPFFVYCRHKQATIEIMKLFIENGADLNIQTSFHSTPFEIICMKKTQNYDFYKYLFEKGANPFIPRPNFLNTLFILSSVSDIKTKFFKLFIDNGAQINATNSLNQTPFHIICSHTKPNVNIISFFLYNDADISIAFGETAWLKIEYRNLKDKELLNKLKFLFSIQWNSIKEDFINIYENGVFLDGEIKGIAFHIAFLEMRTNKKHEEILEILQKYGKKDIQQFIEWIYREKIPEALIKKTIGNGKEQKGIIRNNETVNETINDNDNVIEENNFEKICNEFGILDNINKINLKRVISELYHDEESKDFTIILNSNNKTIKIHKIVLQARSKLYYNLFLSINNPNIDQINDYSGFSFKTLNILFEYLYTEKFNFEIINEEIKTELLEAFDYFQLNEKCAFKYVLKNFEIKK
ncbi:ankyrin repeat-containing protein [Anaeramoeba flamelloides]|uniref:Ankyrin repeat-containing protein n=1 Tax=Anaeramoeba flamelloides TaxID=1746091 RepID=A0AAV7YW15_9EUKA|nr:ankyrin repeat-containing protein [Anaeramoeba flamelloides]